MVCGTYGNMPTRHNVYGLAEGVIRPSPAQYCLDCILPVLIEELSKAGLAVDNKVHDYRVGIPDSEVTKPPEHFDHVLPVWGLGLVKHARPRPFRVLGFALVGGIGAAT